MKKSYQKPLLTTVGATQGIIPAALAAAAATSTITSAGLALVGGYAIGRAAKQVFDAHEYAGRMRGLERVGCC